MKNGGLLRRAHHSAAGLRDAWQRERSFRTHAAFSLGIGALLLAVRPEPAWWGLLVLAAAAGMALEAMNGSLEALADLVEPAYDPRVRTIKDMASASAFIVNCATGLLVILMVLSTS